MAIEITCPSCAATLRVDDSTAGKQVRCGRCMSVLRVPEPPAPPPPAERPLFESGDPYPEEPRAARDEPDRRRDYEEPERGRPRDADDDEAERRRPRDYDDEPRRRPRDYDYDDGEPRPRRRRPPPPSGRSALFWVVVIFGVLILGTCACCGGLYALLPGENWQRHESPAGGFAVEIPGPMQKDLPIPGMKADPNVKVEGTILWKRGECYLVTYADRPAGGFGLGDEALLDEAVREMTSDPAVKRIVRNERITVSGRPARELEYVYEDDGTYIARAVVSHKRLYVVVGGGRFVGPGNANIRRFLDSFEVTDKAPKWGKW